MFSFKRIAMTAASAASAACLALALAGCGAQPAATWAHGSIDEDRVTNYIESVRSSYVSSTSDDDSDASTSAADTTAWDNFIKERSYDTDADSDDSGKDASEDSSEGTVADYRSYVIEQFARNDVAMWEAGQRGIEVTDEEVDTTVEEQKQQIESQYMAGTFESILQAYYGYKDIDAFKDSVKDQILVQKLQQEVTGAVPSDTENYDEAKWDEFMDGLMAYAELKINDMPSGLPYDPATTSADDAESGDGAAQSEEATDEAAQDEEAGSDEGQDK